MTYQKILYLKFKLGLTTQELLEKYPDDRNRVHEVALLEVPSRVLKEVVKEEKALDRLMQLKKRFARFLD